MAIHVCFGDQVDGAIDALQRYARLGRGIYWTVSIVHGPAMALSSTSRRRSAALLRPARCAVSPRLRRPGAHGKATTWRLSVMFGC